MVTKEQLINNLKKYIDTQINVMSRTTPIVNFMKPLLTRALDNNIHRVSTMLDMVTNSEGIIDVDNILTEMISNVISTEPFILHTTFIGDIEMGGGNIKVNLPFINKRLVLDKSDLETFKEMLMNKE